MGPLIGVSRTLGAYLVSSSDPITGTTTSIGWHAVNVSTNDVATSGIMPNALYVVALFPQRTKTIAVQKVVSEITKTATNLGIRVAGGRAEIASGLKRPILAITAVGSGNRFVTPANARAFDTILLSKSAGIEGTSILARLRKTRKLVGLAESQKGADLLRHISIKKDALLAFQTGKVHAMHDVTEGGILGSVYEMSVASNIGFKIYCDAIPIDESTREICARLSVNPLKLIGSGSLLIACSRGSSSVIMRKLRSQKIQCAEIGEFLPLERGRLLETEGKSIGITEDSIHDELWDALRKYGNLS